MRIPITAAKRIADDYRQRQVIMVTWDGNATHVVTYGTTKEECRQAAQGGNLVKSALGWPEQPGETGAPHDLTRVRDCTLPI